MPESAKEGATGLPEGSDIGLGSRDRAFESPHSDQNPQERVAPGGFSLFIAAQNFSIDCYQHSAVLQSCNSVKYEI